MNIPDRSAKRISARWPLAACCALGLALMAGRVAVSAESPKNTAGAQAVTADDVALQTPPPQRMDDEAQRIYRRYGNALYQIQVIDTVTEKKTSIGSGFQFNKEGMIATNYHVVADALQKPQANRLEFVHDLYGTGKLKLLTADVRHDLAILQLEKPNPAYVELGHSDLLKGTKLFSLGNPHDIGFTIVEGTYNGISRESFIDKIHFSGAVNPGMSGGPVLGHDGRVVGVNVMTGGNQIGFLVPVEPLRRLVVEYLGEDPEFDFTKSAQGRLQAQLLEAQAYSLNRMQEKTWDSAPLDNMSVPGRIDPAFKCWGSQQHTEKSPYTHHRTTCASEDNIYLDEGFSTGAYSYSYDILRAGKGFGALRFYNTYEQAYANPIDAFFYMNAQDEKDVTNFECNTRFVDIENIRWKASFCVRRYKKYPLLHDMQLYMARLGDSRKGMIATFAAQGVARDDGIAVIRRFMQSLKPLPPQKEPAADTLPGAPMTTNEELHNIIVPDDLPHGQPHGQQGEAP